MSAVNWKRILAATDFSPFGDRAVACAHTLAELCNAELHVLHVVGDSSEASAIHGISGVLDPNVESDDEYEWLKTILGEEGTVRRVQAVEIGRDVAKKIIAYADANQIDLIVLASHGRKGLQRIWLGSNAEKVVRSARCPVLVLRPSPDELNSTA